MEFLVRNSIQLQDHRKILFQVSSIPFQHINPGLKNVEIHQFDQRLATLACLLPFVILGGLWLRGALRQRSARQD